MKLLSFGDHLSSSEERMRELIGLLISGIRLHAVGQDESRRADFQSELNRIEDQVPKTTKIEVISLLVGQAIQCVDTYHRWVDSDSQIAITEYAQVAVALTQTVCRMSAGNENSLGRLRSVEKKLNGARSTAEIRDVRQELSGCLTDLCDKTIQYREDATRLVSTLQSRLQENQAPQLPRSEVRIEATTPSGLAGRSDAMNSIRQAVDAHVCGFAAALLIDRLPLLSKRFGSETIERLQTMISMDIAQKLRATDQMFEWMPGAFVLVMERTEPIERVKADLRQLSTIKAGKVIEMDNRSVALPTSISCCLFPLFKSPSAEAVEKDIDAFLSAQF